MKTIYRLFLITAGLFHFSACEKNFIEPPANDAEAVFDNLWNTFNEEYAPFEERNVDWDAAYNSFRPLINSNTTDDELFDIISQMIALLDDGHVNLTAPGKEIFFANKVKRELIDDELFNKQVIIKYLEPDFQSGPEESYIYGKVKNEDVAYIFFDHVGENFFELNDFIEKFKHLNGFIIDLRHNQGGDFTYCFSEIGRLTDQSRIVFRSKTKNGKGKKDFTNWKEWHIYPKGDYINKPIFVLTDRYTISAGERSVMAFSTLPNVTVLGDTTNGAHGTMIGRELANGWFYSIVPQKVELFDGLSYEGKGLAPDVYIKNLTSEINQGIDKTLQYAIDELK
jgi:carboxyl-terminal processing protease